MKTEKAPKLRFPEYSSNWTIQRMEDLFDEFRSGQGIVASEISENGTYPVFGGNGLRGYSDEYTHDGFYLLIGRQGALCGNINRSYSKSFISEHAIACKANENSDTEFLAQMLDYIKLNRFSESSAQPGLSVKKLLRHKLVVPSVEEQIKIANFLTTVDARIANLSEEKSLLENYKKGVMQKIFSQELRFKQDDGSDFPEWKQSKLGKLITKAGKKNKDKLSLPVYSINNVQGFLPQSDQFDGVDSEKRGFDTSMYKIVSKQTFAYNPARINVGSIGYSGELENVIISSLYVCFKTKQELEDDFLWHYVKSSFFNKDVLRNVEGGVRQYLFYENLSGIKIKFPSNKEQTKIANFLTSMDEKINTATEAIEKAQEWKKGLLQQLFV